MQNRKVQIFFSTICVAFFFYTFTNMTFESLMTDLTSFDFYLDVLQSLFMGIILSYMAFRKPKPKSEQVAKNQKPGDPEGT